MVERAETVPPLLDATVEGAAPTPVDADATAPDSGDEHATGAGTDIADSTEAHAVRTDRAPALGRGSWLWRGTFVVFLVGAIVAIPLLASVGKEAVEDSTSGRVIDVVTDPAAPGYEVLVEPSPTMLVVQTDGDTLDAVTFLSLSSDATGSGLFLPPETTGLDADGQAQTLRDAWNADGEQGLVEAVERLLGVGILDYADDGTALATEGEVPVVVLDRGQWAQLVEPVAPITIDNPATIEVLGADGELESRFPAGELALEPEAVGPYLAARSAGESDLNRMLRHQLVWEAWIEAITASGSPEAVAGEQDSGLGRYLRSFADGAVGFVVPEASTHTVPGVSGELYAIDEEWLDGLVPQMVPFPRSPSVDVRPVVEVLDGTGTPDASLEVARQLARSGSEIRTIGNGAVFDSTPTRILYYDPDQREAAESIRDALGTGTLELQESLDEVVTVTVVLGPDVVDGLDLPAGGAGEAQ